jgi:L-alanine-DL-glutamate epimerase-like enolase superfamily enzyme
MIRQVHLYHCRLGVGFSYANTSLDEANALVVELVGDGLSGWGEVLLPKVEPLWNWAMQVAPMLLGQDPCQLDHLLEIWPIQNRVLLREADCGTYCHPQVDQVAEAVSIALHDFVGRLQQKPLCELIGKPARRSIPGMPVVHVGPADAMAADSQEWISAGYRHVKIKLSGDADDDISRVCAVRGAVGESVEIQVDANGSYQDVWEAEPLIDALNKTAVDVVEDLFWSNLDACREVRSRLTGSYMVDKEAYWPNVTQVLTHAAADIINLHPHNQGSISNSVRIAQAADRAGVETAIGSSGLFGIQNAAFQQLAAVVGVTRPCEDIGLMPYFAGPVAKRYRFTARPSVVVEPHPVRNGCIELGSGAGLGVEIDPSALRQFTVQEKRFFAS